MKNNIDNYFFYYYTTAEKKQEFLLLLCWQRVQKLLKNGDAMQISAKISEKYLAAAASVLYHQPAYRIDCDLLGAEYILNTRREAIPSAQRKGDRVCFH